MRFLLLFFSFFLVSMSCVFAQRPNISHLKFYKCDYSDTTSYYAVLSSGSKTETTEIWGIDKSLLDSLPSLSEMKLDLEEVTTNAKLYLENRYYSPNSSKEYILTEISFERIIFKEEGNKNWVIIAKFVYDERGFYQYVPILLDGRIILSKWLK
ncbi:hypothetical protein ACE193_09410 [Bernardetia sp. OM2101]|uniref:hypothetical protein n=1 Tax=Bernardetia sp. OM2101 TaxID=3344876 RepID=UPI0035D0B86B